MQITKMLPQIQYKINSFHNSDEEEDISGSIINKTEENDNDYHELSQTLHDQDYQGGIKSIYPKLISQKIEIDRFQDNQPMKINDLSKWKKKRILYFQDQVKKKKQSIIHQKRRRLIDNTKQKTQPLK